jgi:integrase
MHIEARKRQSGTRYRVKVSVSGYPPQSKTFPSKAQAKAWGMQMESDLKSGRLGSGQSQHRTLRETIERFHRERPSGYGEWLHEGRNRQFLRWWSEHLGSFKLGQIKPNTLIQARSKLQDTPIPPKSAGSPPKYRTPATLNRYMSALSAVLQAAVEVWGWTESNPCRGIRHLKENNARDRHLSAEEQERLLEACGKDPNLLDVVKLALYTGARRNEVCGLKWDEVDLSEGAVTFLRTKNNKPRKIPLCKPALELLRNRFRQRTIGVDWVFPAERSAGHIQVSHRFKRFAAKAEVEDFKFHDLRHTSGSAMARVGVPERMMQEVFGHKTAQMTKRYTHLRPSELGGAVEALGDSLEPRSA